MKIAFFSKGNQVGEHFTVFTVDDNNKILSEERIDPPTGCDCQSNIVSPY